MARTHATKLIVRYHLPLHALTTLRLLVRSLELALQTVTDGVATEQTLTRVDVGPVVSVTVHAAHVQHSVVADAAVGNCILARLTFGTIEDESVIAV